jgi:hypothetical protein
MKTLFYISLILITLTSCKKERGSVLYKINFTTNDEITLKKSKSLPDSLYTQFGDYITSLTPSKFTANIWTIGYIDTVFSHSNNNAQMLQYVEQNSEKLPFDDASRIVDFSDNVTVTFNPVRYGRVNNDGQFEDQQINFIYFYFMPRYFYQEVQLPAEYKNVQLNMFSSGSIDNNILKVKHSEMLNKIFPNAQTNNGFNFFFGNTDSTFIVNPNGESISTSENNPITDKTNDLIIRSRKYTNMIYNAPAIGETVVMYGILSFNIKDLIQVYAGADNVPYTSDDIFVYAPMFWERIYSKLDINK